MLLFICLLFYYSLKRRWTVIIKIEKLELKNAEKPP